MATGGAAGALKRFELDGVHDTGREVGHGSYAVVKELEYHGLKCVGKKIHGILFESATPHAKTAMLERFAGECELLSGLRHPHIVQFLGVWYEQGCRVPVLVMEYLHTTLSACLERYGILPKEISYGILRDVALGLCYLHERSPPIIHRDISANNVLLTSNMNAKLSDLGVAKILNLTPARMTQMTQTKAPGTPCYMPPEALTAKPKYTTKIDIYSYGVLIIHTLCGRWPIPQDAFCPDPQNPATMIPISEVERRAEYLQEIGNDHPLTTLVRQCLSNAPVQRPEASALLNRINTILSALPQPFTNRVEMLQQLQTMVHQFEARIQTLTDTYQSEFDSLTQRSRSILESSQSEIKSLEAQITDAHQSKQSEIESLRAEVKRLSVQSPSQQTYTHLSHTREPDIQNQVNEYMHIEVEIVHCYATHQYLVFSTGPERGGVTLRICAMIKLDWAVIKSKLGSVKN